TAAYSSSRSRATRPDTSACSSAGAPSRRTSSPAMPTSCRESSAASCATAASPWSAVTTSLSDRIFGVTQPPVKLLYVAGVANCGSTLLGTLLGQLPGFFFAGEVVHAARALEAGAACGCGLPVADCPVWTEILAAAFAGDDAAADLTLDHADEQVRSVPRHLLRRHGVIGPSPRLDRTARAVAAVAHAARETTGRAVFVDSSKSPGYGAVIATAPGIDLFVLHLVRDSLPTAWSWQKDLGPRSSPTQV